MQCVDHRRGTDPGRLRVLDEEVGGVGLAAGFDPVVDEQHAIATGDQALAETEGEVAVLVVRWRGSLQPDITVAGRHTVFANLDEPDVEVQSDQRPQEAAAGSTSCRTPAVRTGCTWSVRGPSRTRFDGGTLSQTVGDRLRSQHFKAWPLDTVIAELTQGRPYRHVMATNSAYVVGLLSVHTLPRIVPTSESERVAFDEDQTPNPDQDDG